MRFVSTVRGTDPFTAFSAHPLDVSSLKQRIEQHILAAPAAVDRSTVLAALQACSSLEAAFSVSSSPSSPLPETPIDEARSVLQTLLDSDKVNLDIPLLKDYFRLSPPPATDATVEVVRHYNNQLGAETIPQSMSLIPFRRAAYNAEFESALALLDVTVGSNSLYPQYMRSKGRKYLASYAGVAGLVVAGVETFVRSGIIGEWPLESTFMLHCAVLTYLGSLSVYAVLASAGRLSNSGDVLSWSSGTKSLYKLRHAAEMRMASLLASVNSSLPENQGECSVHMIKELQNRQMQPVEIEQETMMKEYWARGGEGFEWVEPDQDPAEILWRHKMELAKSERIGSPFTRDPTVDTSKWTDDVVQQRTLPHASLVDTGDATLPPPPNAKGLPEI